jgi:hypothetical protein
MPAELSESFVNPYPGNRQDPAQNEDSQYFNAKREMEPQPMPQPQPVPEPSPQPTPEPAPKENCVDGMCKIKKGSMFSGLKSKFGSSSSKKGISFIIILILLILGYFGFKKIFENVNELQ